MKEGLQNVVVVPSADTRFGLPLRAHVALLVTSYHHMEHRVEVLRNSVAHDLVPGAYIVVIEHKTGELPIPAPPDYLRLERSTIIAEFEAAGLEVVAAPAFLPYHHILVFRAPADGVTPTHEGAPTLVESIDAPAAAAVTIAGGSGGSVVAGVRRRSAVAAASGSSDAIPDHDPEPHKH